MEGILNSLLRQPPFEFASRRRKFRLAHGPLILTFGYAPTQDDDLKSRMENVLCQHSIFKPVIFK
jgi:hypothetical protein